MKTKNIFEKILINPAEDGCTDLHIVSGYATATMASHHVQSLLDKKLKVKIHLLVGMCPKDGLSQSNHQAFQQLASLEYPNIFECSYVTGPVPVHSKIYTWSKGKTPLCSFVGSANYTQNAFGKGQSEAMTDGDPSSCRSYFEDISRESIYCTHGEVENSVNIYNDRDYFLSGRSEAKKSKTRSPKEINYLDLPAVKISLLDRQNNLPKISGLNWGQRQGREKNQAYIKVPASVHRSGFFPERGIVFTVLTDDGKILLCKRAQDYGKAIETPDNNSRLGEYFRNRLNLKNGAFVNTEDLIKYGRVDIDFYKIDDETYYLDFSKPQN